MPLFNEIKKENLNEENQELIEIIEKKLKLMIIPYLKKYGFMLKDTAIKKERFDPYYCFSFNFLNNKNRREIIIGYLSNNIDGEKHIFYVSIYDDCRDIDNFEVDRFLCNKENKSEKELFYLESYEGDTIGEKLENMFKKWIELFEKHLKGILQGDDLIDGYQIDIGY